MKANELRFNNLYCLNDNVLGGGIRKIVHTDDFITAIELTIKGFLKPIPLTEEWLLKAGFEIIGKLDMPNSPSDWFYSKNDFPFSITYVNKKLQFSNIDLKHVHQLQNLYFALTGEELNFNL